MANIAPENEYYQRFERCGMVDFRYI